MIVVHPLWKIDNDDPTTWHSHLAAAHNAALGMGVTSVEFLNLFDVLRRPYA